MDASSLVQSITHGDIEIRVVRPKCISAGTCTVYAPNTFDIDEQDLAVIKTGEWDTFEKIIGAAESCPVLAIEVYRGTVKVYPK